MLMPGMGEPMPKEGHVTRNVVLPIVLDRRVRKAPADSEKGLVKGALSRATTEALELWLKKHE